MVWTTLFAIGIAQGLFLISLVLYRHSTNRMASRSLSLMLGLMVLSNLSYLTIRTELLRYVPQIYGLSFGSLFLFGPLLYFYSRSILESEFRWRPWYGLHFLPVAIQMCMTIPWYLQDKALWIAFIDAFLEGRLTVDLYPKIVYAIQNLHLLIYLMITVRKIRLEKGVIRQIQYIVPVDARIQWLTRLTVCLGILLATVFSMYIVVIVNGKFNPITNYVYTIVTSGIIYFIAYAYVLNPELITPGFIQKYRTYMPFDGREGEQYTEKLRLLLEKQKVYINPELKLSDIASELGLPQHQVSKLINEKFGKSFTDLINAYRVQEFIDRVNRPEYQSHSVFGLALDVGFNSKSAFNSAFKKLTGRTPSEYRLD